jgi:hypothetical protein
MLFYEYNYYDNSNGYFGSILWVMAGIIFEFKAIKIIKNMDPLFAIFSNNDSYSIFSMPRFATGFMLR